MMDEVLILGISNPFDVLLISSMAEASAGEEELLIATFCEYVMVVNKQIRNENNFCNCFCIYND